MACLNSTTAWVNPDVDSKFSDKKITFLPHEGEYYRTKISVPCGKCVKCRAKRMNEWGLRVENELSEHEHSCFITLTYDDANVPDDYELVHRDFQLFMKRLRKHRATRGMKEKIRYIMCGEYGKQSTRRPHFHAIIFGHDFSDDRKKWKVRRRRDGSTYIDYISKNLSALWPKGHHVISDACYRTGRYIAKYSLKTNETANEQEKSEYIVCSNGIGASFARKHAHQIGRDQFVRDARGRKHPVPKYYLQFLSDDDYDFLVQSRKWFAENTPTLTLDEERAQCAIQVQKLRNVGSVGSAEKLYSFWTAHIEARQELIDEYGHDIGDIFQPVILFCKSAPQGLIEGIDYPDNVVWVRHYFCFETEVIDTSTGELLDVIPKHGSKAVCYY